MTNTAIRLPAATRFLAILSITLLLAGATQAYTLVMRSGRRVEIPERFTVTPSTLTYEAAPGIQVTIQMVSIDVAATERANREAPGAFFAHVQAAPKISAQGQVSARRVGANHDVTNRDLESYAQRRLQAERVYEKRRVELGLPSLEESRKRAAAEAAAIEAELSQRRERELESETYWRARASTLRTEMEVVNAEIASFRNRLEQIPFTGATASFTVFNSVLPLSLFRRSAVAPALSPQRRPPVFTGSAGHQFGGRFGVSPGTRRQVFAGGSGRPINSALPIFSPRFGFPLTTVFTSPYQLYDFGYEQTFLITRLNELRATRDGLAVRWRVLEDEARRAGVPPGWLRK